MQFQFDPNQDFQLEAIAAVVAVSYTHLRAHETVLDLVCRLLLEKKNNWHTYEPVSALADTYTNNNTIIKSTSTYT